MNTASGLFARGLARLAERITSPGLPLLAALLFACILPLASAANFTRGTATAVKFGVHEITLTGNGSVANPQDTIATVTFTPPSGAANARTVHAFHDGGHTWRARVYVSETGAWTWTSASATDAGLNAKSGAFTAAASSLRGKLVKHPANPKAWATDDGAWFLNVSDTGYYLFNEASTQWQDFVTDDWDQGVNSIRVNMVGALRQFGKQQVSDGWDRVFADAGYTTLNQAAFALQDQRMEWMLNNRPGMYLQLIVTPEPGQSDDRVWYLLSAAQRERFLRNIVARYAAWPQVFWLVTNDAFVSNHPRNVAMINEIGAYLAANDPWADKNLRSNGQRRDTGFSFLSADWVNYIHLETTYDLSAAQEDAYSSTPMHVYNGEDWYEEEKPITNDAYFFRRLYWAYTLSGGSACYGGAWNRILSYDTAGFTGLDSAPHVGAFFAGGNLTLVDYLAADSRVTGPSGQRKAKAMRTADSRSFVIYHPNAAADNYQTVPSTGTASFTVTSLPSGSYSLRWMRADNGTISNAADFTHGGGNRAFSAPWSGTDVVAWLRPAGGSTSQAPSITSQPQGQTVNAGQTATFSVSATGTPAPAYQWQKNSANIPGATSSSYTTPVTTSGDNGSAYRVVVSNSASSVTSASATLTVNALPGGDVPAPWSSNDIGSVGISGDADHASGVFTIQGSGADINGTADAFHFVHQVIEGDCDIIARVSSQTNTHSWAKAGVMIRESLDPNAKRLLMVVTPNYGFRYQYRLTTGGSTPTSTGGGSLYASPNNWVRLVRDGDDFTAYKSADGSNWTQVASTSIPMNSAIYVGLAVCSHDNSELSTATFDNVSVSGNAAGGLPSPWAADDLGSVALTGSTDYASGVFTIQGAGIDINGSADAFHFVRQPASGDCEIIARVTSQTNTDTWAKAGVMIRESLLPGSRHAIMVVTPGNGFRFQRRDTTDATTPSSAYGGGLNTAPNNWVRLVRSGDTFTGYKSADGSNWTQVSSVTIPMAPNVYIGLPVCSHDSSALSTVTIDNVSVNP